MSDSGRDAASIAIAAFERAIYPEKTATLANAWLGIYQALLWYEHGVPHIIDADKLRSNTIWRERARLAEGYIAERLGCGYEDVERLCDQLMKNPAYRGAQRQNPLGKAFAALVRHVLERFCGLSMQYNTEVDARDIWPGIEMPGRSSAPRIDILVINEDRPIAIISAKWSLRHDRVGDITSECPAYKAAAFRLRQPIRYFVVTNEFDPSRLIKVLDDECVDGVFHVHKRLVTEIARLDGRLNDMADLIDLPASLL
ncbi:MAG TPA: hypothetical protein GX509_05920 [Firmicutes bacterium]|nr:hypothetical protein [Bacillota bacterium]